MVRRVLAVSAFALVSSQAPGARADTPKPTPIDGLGADIADAFTGTNHVLYGAAVVETGAMAYSGGDHAARRFVQLHLAAPAWGDAAFVAGYVLPPLLAGAIWGTGLATEDRWALGAGSAAMQALALTAATTALLKWTAGRTYPLNGGDPHDPARLDHPEYARELRPFNLGGGWAWPSGHTSAITSVVAALSAWDPEHVAIPLVGYPVAAAIGLGMIDGDHHWTSDVVAGALIGYAIGHSVGTSFRRRARGEKDDVVALRIVPLAGGAFGASIAGGW